MRFGIFFLISCFVICLFFMKIIFVHVPNPISPFTKREYYIFQKVTQNMRYLRGCEFTKTPPRLLYVISSYSHGWKRQHSNPNFFSKNLRVQILQQNQEVYLLSTVDHSKQKQNKKNQSLSCDFLTASQCQISNVFLTTKQKSIQNEYSRFSLQFQSVFLVSLSPIASLFIRWKYRTDAKSEDRRRDCILSLLR